MNYHSITTLIIAGIIVENIVLYIIYFYKKSGKTIRQWYREFKIGAYSMDITPAIIGSYLAILLAHNFYMQLVYVVIIGLIHDTSFGLFLNSINTKSNKVLQFFKDYAKENGKTILMWDALILVSTLVVSKFLYKTFSNTIIIFLGIVSIYIGLLFVYSF